MRYVLAARFLDDAVKPARGGTVAVASAFLPPVAAKAMIRIAGRRPRPQQEPSRGLPIRRRLG